MYPDEKTNKKLLFLIKKEFDRQIETDKIIDDYFHKKSITKDEQDAIIDDNKCFVDKANSKFEQDALAVLIVCLAAACVLVGLFIVEVFHL